MAFPAVPFELFSKLRTLSFPIVIASIEEYAEFSRPFLPPWHVRLTRLTVLIASAAIVLAPYAFYVYLTGVLDALLVLLQLCFLWALRRLYRAVTDSTGRMEVLLNGLCMGALMLHRRRAGGRPPHELQQVPSPDV